MNWKLGGPITVAGIILLFVVMFYSGMFMHGD
jgi:hypothetical protein